MATPKRVTKPDDQVNQCIAQQDLARQMQSFQVMGRLYSVETAQGRIQFDEHKGPGIAQIVDANREPTGELLFVSPWEKLPDRPEYSEEFCQACLVTCDICKGSGKSMCTLCGGVGSVKAGEKPCPCITMTRCLCVHDLRRQGVADPLCGICLGKGEIGSPDFNCKYCGGHGALPERQECESCHMTKLETCGPCRGTGKQPSGKKGNDLCPHCRGSRRNGKWKAQDLSQVIVGKMGDCLVIGPVLRFVAIPPVSHVPLSRLESRFQVGDAPQSGSFLRVKPGDTGVDLYIMLPMITRKGQPMMAYCYQVEKS